MMRRRQVMQWLGLGGFSAILAGTAYSGRGFWSDWKKPSIQMMLYPKCTALDLIGPQHVFSLLEGYQVDLVWKTKGEVVSDTGIPMRATMEFANAPKDPELIFIPGGTEGTLAIMEDPEVMSYLRERGESAKFVTSVCTGSLVLGAAGLLKGYRATSHWLVLEQLKGFGVEAVSERVVEDRNRITGAGVTAGLDFALQVAERLKGRPYAEAVQLMMEYDPQPPFASGNPRVASASNVQMLKAMTQPFQAKLGAAIERLQMSAP